LHDFAGSHVELAGVERALDDSAIEEEPVAQWAFAMGAGVAEADELSIDVGDDDFLAVHLYNRHFALGDIAGSGDALKVRH
jgi:hypothetical protein